VILGAGAAGNAITRLLSLYGVGDALVVDSRGIVAKSRVDLNPFKRKLADITNKTGITGSLAEAIEGADAVVGVSKAGLLKEEHIAKMNTKAIVFALANPVPEIFPYQAKKAGAFIVATGRSDSTTP
jgi:malate dehydrogenase (oxaloacetate-decarboxylating)